MPQQIYVATCPGGVHCFATSKENAELIATTGYWPNCTHHITQNAMIDLFGFALPPGAIMLLPIPSTLYVEEQESPNKKLNGQDRHGRSHDTKDIRRRPKD